MIFQSVSAALGNHPSLLTKGPIALIFVEDDVEIQSTITHHVKLGFRQVFVMFAGTFEYDQSLQFEANPTLHMVQYSAQYETPYVDVTNAFIAAAPEKTWFFYCFNSEYLYYPFSETRSIAEILVFNSEERRPCVLTYVIDLYASDLGTHPTGIDLETAHFDKAGYFAMARPDPDNNNHPRAEQLDFYGGLKWRFEEYIPKAKRRIDRMAIFRTKEKLMLGQDHLFNIQEHNTYCCPWHNNITAALASFRTAKALRRNPGSRFDVKRFSWHNSEKFTWTSRQFLELGIIEPGQWF